LDQDYAIILYNVRNCEQLAIGTADLPDGQTGASYAQSLSLMGGAFPVTWAIVDGALPPGLSLTTGGAIAGIPTDVGAYTFTARATDATGCWETRAYGITIHCSAVDIPSITAHPTAQSICLNGTASFSVSAESAPPLSYQWRKIGLPISGATGSTFRINSVNDSDLGAYDVIVSNECSQAVSLPASLDIIRPVLVGNPGELIVPTCKTVTFSAIAGSQPPSHYQWRRDGVPLVDDDRYHGSQSETLSIGPVIRGDSGAYDVVVSTTCGEIVSDSAVLVVQGNDDLMDCPQSAVTQTAAGPCAQGVLGMGFTTILSLAGWGAWRRRQRRTL
jgi:hypothetical protein